MIPAGQLLSPGRDQERGGAGCRQGRPAGGAGLPGGGTLDTGRISSPSVFALRSPLPELTGLRHIPPVTIRGRVAD